MKSITLLIAITALIVSLVSMFFNPFFGSQIKNNPKAILDSVNKFMEEESKDKQKKYAEDQKKANSYIAQHIVEIVANTPIIGSQAAQITIVKFSDYNCSYCRVGNEILSKVLKKYEGKVNVAIKEFPILSPASEMAASIALAVYNMDKSKFGAFHEKAFKKQSFNEKDLYDIVGSLGLSAEKVKKEAESDKVKGMLKANRELAQKLAISGTPAFIIGTELVGGLIDQEAMSAKIEALLSEKK